MAPTSFELASRLREMIRQKKYVVGESLGNERDLAAGYHVSRTTVRRALQVLERERLIVRQQGRGTFVSDLAHSDRPVRPSVLLGALVFEHQYFFDAVLQGACGLAEHRGYLVTTGSNATEAEETAHVNVFIRDRIPGVLMAPRGVASRDNYRRLIDAGIPVVLVEALIPDCPEDYVGVDNAEGTRKAVRFLAGLGHRRIGYVGHNEDGDLPCRSERLRGFREECRSASLTVPEKWIIEANQTAFAAPLAKLLSTKDRPSAIVAYNDNWAIRTIGAARNLGLKVPRDLSVIGFDDCVLASGYDIPITSVNPHYREIGTAAVKVLIDKIDDPKQNVKIISLVTPSISVRESTCTV